MKALVTGGTGFIGHHLIEALVDRGDEVTALVRSEVRAERIVEMGVRTVLGDLDDAPALAKACKGAELVFHVAGAIKSRDEAGYFRANEQGTRNLVRSAEAAGDSRFVFVSSMAAAGPTEPGRPLTGDEPARPVTAYGRSKLAAEEVVRRSKLPWTIVRPPAVYGPRDRALLPVFKLARRGFGAVFGDGSQELSAVYGPDLVDALLASVATERTVGRTYYACHRELFCSTEFVRTAGRALGRELRIVRLSPIVTRMVLSLTGAAAALAGRATLLNRDKANEFLARAWTGDPGPFARDTGWVANHALAEGLPQTATWYQEEGWL
jgi:nucleoside-diphosphate-sugar epimerase